MRYAKFRFAMLAGFAIPLSISSTAFAQSQEAQGSSNVAQPQITTSPVTPSGSLPPMPFGMSSFTPDCLAFDNLNPRSEPGALPPSSCETLSPHLGGVRDALADNGIGFGAQARAMFSYDLLRRNANPQLYPGQDPTWGFTAAAFITYDLNRIGFTPGAQLTVDGMWMNSNFTPTSPNQATVVILAVNQPLLNGQLELQYGYYPLLTEFYGLFFGGTPSKSTLGPISIIPSEVGMSLEEPTPSFDVTVRSPNHHFYNHFAVSRSQSPAGFAADVAENPTGLRLTVPGARALFVDEFGYKTEASEGRAINLRAGGIYNTSHYSRFTSLESATSNYGAYVAGTYQLTQPHPGMPNGLYLDIKADYAPPDRNLFTSDFQISLFDIGPFYGRPLDMISVGFSKTFFSSDARAVSAAFASTVAAANSTGYSISYAARIIRGVYWINSLTYTQNPTFAPKSPDSLVFNSGLSLAF
ncbi:carbohydrate porin [Paraburkholderia agricolaris]|uniref:Carbohydrate porin n=1 Tax=Paraburkholderia agricolaris TaxID=2152888 RepID=A0ABW9A2S9_9BURK